MTLETDLGATRPLIFCAVKIVAPFATLRILDGESTLTIDAETYTGGSDYGDLAGLDTFTDGDGNTAPRLKVSLYLPSDDLISDWLDPEVQGSPVTVWLGAVDRATGAAVSEVIFRGEVDQPTLLIGRDKRWIDLDTCSYLERFFDLNTGVRLNDAWHQSIWPGEKGLDQVTGINRQQPWGIGGGGTAFKGGRAQEQIWIHRPFSGGHFSQVFGGDPKGLF